MTQSAEYNCKYATTLVINLLHRLYSYNSIYNYVLYKWDCTLTILYIQLLLYKLDYTLTILYIQLCTIQMILSSILYLIISLKCLSQRKKLQLFWSDSPWYRFTHKKKQNQQLHTCFIFLALTLTQCIYAF